MNSKFMSLDIFKFGSPEKNIPLDTLKQMTSEQFMQFSQSELNELRLSPNVYTHSHCFKGFRDGYVFTVGSSGVGYYLDLPLPDYTGEGDYSKIYNEYNHPPQNGHFHQWK